MNYSSYRSDRTDRNHCDFRGTEYRATFTELLTAVLLGALCAAMIYLS